MCVFPIEDVTVHVSTLTRTSKYSYFVNRAVFVSEYASVVTYLYCTLILSCYEILEYCVRVL